MADHTTHSPPVDFFGLLPAEVERTVGDAGWPTFRARQVLEWVHRRQVSDPACMTNLSRQHRDLLPRLFRFDTATVARRQDSADGTIKLLLTWPDGAQAETVMIPEGVRRTACVSSQVGCPVGCRFCASGIDGVRGNLSAAQIVEQVFQINRALAGPVPRQQPAATPSRITHIVFMGMGEPMANYGNVLRAVRVLHDPLCFNISARKITLSTVGVPPRIRELADESLPVNLALSLHAPNEPLRRQLIPWANHFSLDDILDACRYYFDRTGREITLEYILLAGVNDQPEHAVQLARLARTLRANVNLIRYNEVQSLPFVRPAARDVMRFQNLLRKAHVNAHVRRSRGRDIDAACGQLRRSALPVVGGTDRGFTAVELLVVLGILVVLTAIFVPYSLKLREENRRVLCREHLQQLFRSLQAYAADNGTFFPRVRYEPAEPLRTFVGGRGDPFAGPANNVTASLWLLVRGGYLKDTGTFLCPVGGTAARLDSESADFASPAELGYSYASPFGATEQYRLTDVLKPEFVLMADLNPGGANALPATAPRLAQASINSPNHRKAGQNVLYAYGAVQWQWTPYCGMNHDNIYTVRGQSGTTHPSPHPSTDPGHADLSILPAAEDDSFLLPAAR